MIKLFLITIFLVLTLQANIIDFYRSAVKTLQYDKTYSLYKKSATLSQNAIVYTQYANVSLDASYATTKAKTLQNSFITSDITLNDTIDIFNKKRYLIDTITLDMKAQKFLLESKKEQLFNALISMISLYHTQSKKITLNQALYDEQLVLYKKLHILEQHGAISNLDLLRFKNTLTGLQTKIIKQKNNLLKMKKQLSLYVPNQAIPNLDSTIKYSKEQFLSHNPQAKANEAIAEKSIKQAQLLKHNYLPELTAGVAYQKLDDPTSYGDNYSFKIGMHLPLNTGNFKEAEALQVDALSQKNRNIEFQFKRENEYITLTQNYQSAEEQLVVLKANLNDYKQSQETIKTAFLQQFVDFNSYLQVLTQTLQIQEQIIDLNAQASQNATLINYIASGVIYE